MLSQFYEESYALDLIGDRAEGVGYLLKERVGDVSSFVDAVQRVAAGGSALDPEIVGRMLGRRRADGPLDELTPREREVLAAMAEGKSNAGIAEELVVTEAAVEKHVGRIFNKLGLGAHDHRAPARARGAHLHARLPPIAIRARGIGGRCCRGPVRSRTLGRCRPPGRRQPNTKGFPMILKHNRIMAVLAATAAALAVGASPALAGEDDDDEYDDDEVTQVAPVQSSGSEAGLVAGRRAAGRRRGRRGRHGRAGPRHRAARARVRRAGADGVGRPADRRRASLTPWRARG